MAVASDVTDNLKTSFEIMPNVPIIGGKSGVLTFGPRENPERDRYWAENGIIHVESDNNSYETLSVRDFLLRLKALSDMLGNSKQAAKDLMPGDEYDRTRQFVEAGVDLARKAQEQGMPTDKDAVKEANRRRKKTVVMPSAKHQM